MSDLDECRARLPISALWGRLGLRGSDKVEAITPGNPAKINSPWRDDKNPSFSVWVEDDGHGFWKDHGTGESGDDVQAIERARGLSTGDAIKLFCEFAGVRNDGGGGETKKSPVKKPAVVERDFEVVRKSNLADRLEGKPVPKKKKTPAPGGRPEIKEVYSYQDARGELAHETLRFEPKGFRQRRPGVGDEGEWVWSLKDHRVYPYRLPRILKARKVEPIFLVEGEKDVENLERLGEEVIATCLPMGAGKWRDDFAEYFRDRWVVIIPDYDKPGLEGAEKIARELFEVCERVGLLMLDDLWKGAKVGDDISDWILGGWNRGVFVDDQVEQLMGAAETAELEEIDFFSDCLLKSSRGGVSLYEDRLARRLVKSEGLIFCGDFFYRWEKRLGLWEKRREKTWIERKVRRAMVDCGGEELVTKARVGSIVGLARSEKVVFPEQLNSYPEGTFPVRNGLLDVETGKLFPHRHGYFTTVQTPHNYIPGAECPEWMRWLEDRQEDEATRAQIQEIFGYCLGMGINYHSFFFLYGEGGTGKSTCVDVLEWLVGENNRVSLELTELDNPFTRQQLVGKSLFLAKELTSRSFKHIGLIKAIVSGDPIGVDVKFGTGFDFRPNGRLVMESNVAAMTPDSSGGFERRFIQVNFEKPIDRKNMEYGFQGRFREEMSGILNWALVGYQRLAERGRFEHTERSQAATDDLLKHRAQVATFLKSGVLVDEGPGGVRSVRMDRVFELYQDWCEAEDVVPWFKEKSTFAREFFTKRPEWSDRKKREWFDGIRDYILRGVKVNEIENDE